MPRNDRRRLNQREPLDPTRQPEALQPQERVGPGDAGDGMGRLLEALDAAAPGAKSLARTATLNNREEQRAMAEADAVSEAVSGTMPDDIEKEAEKFEDPFYRDAWKAKRTELAAQEKTREIKQTIAENQNKPDFDANQYWQEQTQDILSRTPDDLKGQIADKMGIAHGNWQKRKRKKQIENQAVANQETFTTSVENHVEELDAADAAPNQETMQAFVEDAAELNIPERKARAIYLDRVGRYASENAKPGLLKNLDQLKNDPELAEEYEKFQDSAQAQADKQASVWETETRAEYQALAQQGEFSRKHVREIANDPQRRELYGEEQLAQMLLSSRRARGRDQGKQLNANAWLSQPNDWAAANGEELSSADRTAVFTKGLASLQERYPDNPEKAYRLWVQKMAETGTAGTSEKLEQQLKARGTVTDLNAADGEIPEQFKQGYQQYRTLTEDIAGGDDVVARHLAGSQAEENYDIYNDFKQAGYDDSSAYHAMRRLRRDAQDLGDFRGSEASREIESAASDLDVSKFPGEARSWVKEKAQNFGRLGMSAEKSIELAKKAHRRTHTNIRGASIYHGGDVNAVNRGEEVVSWHLENRREELAKAIGLDSEEMDMDEVSIRQSHKYPSVMVPYHNGQPIPGEQFELPAKKKEMLAQKKQDKQESLNEQRRLNDELLELGRDRRAQEYFEDNNADEDPRNRLNTSQMGATLDPDEEAARKDVREALKEYPAND